MTNRLTGTIWMEETKTVGERILAHQYSKSAPRKVAKNLRLRCPNQCSELSRKRGHQYSQTVGRIAELKTKVKDLILAKHLQVRYLNLARALAKKNTKLET